MAIRIVSVRHDECDAYLGRKMPGRPTEFTRLGNPVKHVCADRAADGERRRQRFIQTLKLELIWLRDWEGIEELRAAVEAWRRFYNDEQHTRRWTGRLHPNAVSNGYQETDCCR